jgi:hypothetical protein
MCALGVNECDRLCGLVATIMLKAFDWKRSRISMLEVEAIPQSCIP